MGRDRKAWIILALSLVSVPAALALSRNHPIFLLVISTAWLVSPALFVEEKPTFNLCLSMSLFFVALYVRALIGSAMSEVDRSSMVAYHLEQVLAFVILLFASRHFFGLAMLRMTRQGLAKAIILGAAVGLSFGFVDYLSGERAVPMPDFGVAGTVAWIVSLSLLVGMQEELLFRGAIYRPARNIFGPRLASLFQAFIFSMAHYPNPISALSAALLFGVAMVLLVERTGSLFAPVTAHACNNVVWLMLARFL